jgi:flagellar biosynthesis/type III secretory pathway protein FliH
VYSAVEGTRTRVEDDIMPVSALREVMNRHKVSPPRAGLNIVPQEAPLITQHRSRTSGLKHKENLELCQNQKMHFET